MQLRRGVLPGDSSGMTVRMRAGDIRAVGAEKSASADGCRIELGVAVALQASETAGAAWSFMCLMLCQRASLEASAAGADPIAFTVSVEAWIVNDCKCGIGSALVDTVQIRCRFSSSGCKTPKVQDLPRRQ